MPADRFITSPSGVRIRTDFRDNLIIDRYDPLFAQMRASKQKHLCSENSEDAVTWNVFRSLRQIDPRAWLPQMAGDALPGQVPRMDGAVTISLWQSVAPPPALLQLGDEGASEIDVIIESPFWVWFVEAKYRSDISTGTTTRPLRNQVLRNIDVGSYYAGTRNFYFSLLVRSAEQSPLGAEAVAAYAGLEAPRQLLAEHRPDGLANLRAVTLMNWAQLGTALGSAAGSAEREDERGYAERALQWLREKKLS